ncbi:MAG: OmpA family protein, partial [Desulfobaccales bacterium]
PSKVYFEVAQAAIGPEGLKVIKEAAACIKEKGLKVDITGYTDKTGDFDKNLELAKNRAKAVQDALVAEGLTVETINLTAPLLHTVVGTTGTGTDAEARRVEINKAGVLNVSLLFWQQQKDMFLQNYTDRLQGLNKKIDDLKALMATAKPETKAKLQAALNLLLEKQAAITKLLSGSKEASGKAWDDLKASLDDSLKQLTQEVDKTSKP